MKKISFVNPNFQQGPKEFNAFYLPYSVGVIWSYVSQFESINTQYRLGEFIWRRDNIQDTIQVLNDSAVIGFSTYVWNKSYNYVLARELKKLYPNIIIIFGGPEPPIQNKNFFKTFPFIDIVVKQEGEISFKKILEKKTFEDIFSVPGLLLNTDGNTVDTGKSSRITNLDDIPSPYLNGTFDTLIEKYPDITWNATLETNRGCPYQCTFCDWGSLTYNKVKKFNLERVFAELEWIGSTACDFVSITDANFGIFPERDKIIADKLIEVQKKFDNPKAYTIAWAKNQKKDVVDIVQKLIYSGGAKIGLNLSVQSLDNHTLEVIKRQNLEMNKIETVFELCEENNIPLYTELILGLPGETLESWKNNFYKLYKMNNHTGITVYQAQLLENAEMNLTQKDQYKIKGQIVYDYLVGAYNEDELKEGIEIVIETKDLSFDDMLNAQLFSWLQNTFHINGLTNYISRFLYKFYNVEYDFFYNKFFKFILKDFYFNNEVVRIKDYYYNWMSKGKIDHPKIQGIEIHGWNLIHSSVINIHNKNITDHVFTVITQYLIQTYKFLSTELLEQLLVFQKNFFIDYYKIHTYPKNIEFQYDFLGYICNDSDLYKNSVIKYDFPEDKSMSLQRFSEQIFFARRRNFGKAWLTKIL